MRYTGKNFGKTVSTRTEVSPSGEYSTKMQVLQSVPVKDDITGRVKYISQIVEVDMASEMSKYNVEDFYLENMIADGSINSLGQCTIPVPGMVDIDRVSLQLPKIDDYLASNIAPEAEE